MVWKPPCTEKGHASHHWTHKLGKDEPSLGEHFTVNPVQVKAGS